MKNVLLLLLTLYAAPLLAQEPPGYYNSTLGKAGIPLQMALKNVIGNHIVKTYAELWEAFYTTDRKPNGKVWDIYSDIPGGNPPYEYTFGTDQCGNYNSENDCYNREHSWPQSYFNDAMPMRTDLFHVYPTDGWVNNKRGNDAYGVVNTTGSFWQSQNGSRSGANSYPGYQGTVFEPLDSFKGDLARTYFYMSTRYYGEDGGWQTWSMATGAELKPWVVNMLMEWHNMDPVSAKELDRNEAIYHIQGNRNPFIDHPEFADCIWNNVPCGDSTVGITNNDYLSKVKVFPNPAVTHITVDLSLPVVDEVIAIELLSMQGRVVYHKSIDLTQRQLMIDVQPFAKGVYVLRLLSKKQAGHKKVVLQ